MKPSEGKKSAGANNNKGNEAVSRRDGPNNDLNTSTGIAFSMTEGSGGSSLVSDDGDETSNSSLYDSSSMSPTSKGESPFICSPQSFPPTPRSRQMVLARGSQFADDVVFLARDRLRIHDALESGNERTREVGKII